MASSPAPPAAASPSTVPQAAKKKKEEPKKPREYNQRWLGYSLIQFTSLVCFASIANLIRHEDLFRKGSWVTGMSVGIITFSISFLIVIFDRLKFADKFCDFTKTCDGKLEGYTLILFVILWIVGIATLTHPNGIAYYASNIYFSAWGALASCLYTLNEWSTEKDIISFRELTQLSTTLKTWYILLLLSLVFFGSSIGMLIKVSDRFVDDAGVAIAIGGVSSLISLLWILIHYKFFEGIKAGGWLELVTAFFLILMWTIGIAIFTQYDGIAPLAVGSGCRAEYRGYEIAKRAEANCTLVYTYTSPGTNETIVNTASCGSLYENDVPGSNLYLTGWGALFGSINLTLRWKAAQALKFAQAAQSVVGRSGTGPTGQNEVDQDDEEDL